MKNCRQKRIKLNLLFKPSYLISNFALTVGYLNPASNNPARSNIWWSTFRIDAGQLRSVTETAPKSPPSCVNKSSIRYGFRAGERALRYSVVITYVAWIYIFVTQFPFEEINLMNPYGDLWKMFFFYKLENKNRNNVLAFFFFLQTWKQKSEWCLSIFKFLLVLPVDCLEAQ